MDIFSLPIYSLKQKKNHLLKYMVDLISNLLTSQSPDT